MLERTVGIFLTLMVAVAGGGLAWCSFDKEAYALLSELVKTIPGNWLYTLGGAAAVCLVLWFFFLGCRGSGEKIEMQSSDLGKVTLSKAAFENYALFLTRSVAGIEKVKVKAGKLNKGVRLTITGNIVPGIPAGETSKLIKETVVERLKEMTGLEIREVCVHFRNIALGAGDSSASGTAVVPAKEEVCGKEL